ncbi:MAG: helix-turn-helix transcriptional regulator [Rhodanobacteraceae bacterium]|nr:helix-turn-helix transcriptional regulator [Rhodanobacteraceae bacterium]
MNYREWAAPETLRPWVACLWSLQAPAGEKPHTVYPDGRCEFIVHRGAPPWVQDEKGRWQAQQAWLFAAQGRQALRLWAREPLDCLGLRLQPAASASFWSAERLVAWRDRVVGLGAEEAALAQALLKQDWATLRARLQAPPDAAIQAACARLDALDGCSTVAALAAHLGLGLRSLQGRFLRAVGLSPKEYARIRRLQATLRLLDAGSDSLADAAHQAGFADQAHAHRELRAMTGLTPARLRQALMQERDGDQTLALAAAFVRGR